MLDRVRDGDAPRRNVSAPTKLGLLATTGITTEAPEGGSHEDRLNRPPSPATFSDTGFQEVSEGLLSRVGALGVSPRSSPGAHTPPSPMRPPSTSRDSSGTRTPPSPMRPPSSSLTSGNLPNIVLDDMGAEPPPKLSSRPYASSGGEPGMMSLSPSIPPRPNRPGLRK